MQLHCQKQTSRCEVLHDLFYGLLFLPCPSHAQPTATSFALHILAGEPWDQPVWNRWCSLHDATPTVFRWRVANPKLSLKIFYTLKLRYRTQICDAEIKTPFSAREGSLSAFEMVTKRRKSFIMRNQRLISRDQRSFPYSLPSTHKISAHCRKPTSIGHSPVSWNDLFTASAFISLKTPTPVLDLRGRSWNVASEIAAILSLIQRTFFLNTFLTC